MVEDVFWSLESLVWCLVWFISWYLILVIGFGWVPGNLVKFSIMRHKLAALEPTNIYHSIFTRQWLRLCYNPLFRDDLLHRFGKFVKISDFPIIQVPRSPNYTVYGFISSLHRWDKNITLKCALKWHHSESMYWLFPLTLGL